jgi:formylglycine-generating enzyme required for sulfatase activity
VTLQPLLEGALPALTVSERCLRYEAPSVCASKQRRPMRFCMDRYEWPNQKGELPALLVSWVDAKKQCEAIGKRLCTEDEFNFACEGEEMLPYTYGFERDPTKCNIDRPYRKREKKLFKYARCMKDPVCKAELEKLDQRLPTGSLPACVSPFGVYDLNGNINEWVFRPKEKPPSRSGLKGGWWGPVRGRCRWGRGLPSTRKKTTATKRASAAARTRGSRRGRRAGHAAKGTPGNRRDPTCWTRATSDEAPRRRKEARCGTWEVGAPRTSDDVGEPSRGTRPSKGGAVQWT